MNDKPYNASDPQEIEEQQEKLDLQREKELNDLRFVLKTAQGRRVFKRILDKGGIFRNSFTGNSKTFFLEGRRDLAQFLLAEGLEAAPQEMLSVLINMQEKEKSKI